MLLPSTSPSCVTMMHGLACLLHASRPSTAICTNCAASTKHTGGLLLSFYTTYRMVELSGSCCTQKTCVHCLFDISTSLHHKSISSKSLPLPVSACCSRTSKTQKLSVKRSQLDRMRKQPDPRQKAPELQEVIQGCSRDMLKLVRMHTQLTTIPMLVLDPACAICHACMPLQPLADQSSAQTGM